MRQSTTPVQFDRTTRYDRATGMTSGRAGKMVPLHYIPVLRGDSLSATFQARFDLAEMPRPLQNAVLLNVQAWFVPKSAHPKFSGYDEFIASYHGKQITALGSADRDPPPFFSKLTGTNLTTWQNSEFLKTLGIHNPFPANNTDLVDAYNLVWNFRAAAHSNAITRRPYATEDTAEATSLAPAFWPSGKFANIVPDYERALVVGALDLDVASGVLPVRGLGVTNAAPSATDVAVREVPRTLGGTPPATATYLDQWSGADLYVEGWAASTGPMYPAVYAEMVGQTVGTTLADIDKARTTQAFAKLRTAYVGNDFSGFDNDEAIIAELMQGFRVPEEQFKRPWLLDHKRTTFGMVERHATDAANLDQSVTKGQANVQLSLNLPAQDVGGYIIVVAEVVPEQLHERQGDWSIILDSVAELPDALRDVQRIEPVDNVRNWRVDAAHTFPNGFYGFEPMNHVWMRDFTRLGGIYYQANPALPFTEARAGIWQVGIVDPTFSTDHYVCPVDFPHTVFSDTLAPAFEVAFRCSASIRGLTQFGDVLRENTDDYASLIKEQADYEVGL